MDAVLNEVGMMIEPYPYGGWGPNCYLIRSSADRSEIYRWLHENAVDHWMVSSGSNGYVIQIKDNFELFTMRWA